MKRLSVHVFMFPVTASVVLAGATLFAAVTLPQKPGAIPMPTPTPPIPAFHTGVRSGDFAIALQAVLAKDIEGGFVDDPRDPGGATNMGMSLREVRRLDADNKLSAYLKDALDVDNDGDIDSIDVRRWMREHAETFYREYYWEPVAGARLPHPIAMIVFDSAVNEGVQRAAKHLQRCVGVPADGIIGKNTIAATWAWKIAPGALRPEEEVFLSRLNRYATLDGAPTYFSGWARRSLKILKIAQS